MTEQENKTGDLQLHAYIDGELDAESRAAVEDFLAAHPEAAARVEAFRAQGKSLHALYDGVLAEPVPPAMRALLARGGRAHRAAPWMRAAAAIVLLAAGAAGGWFARDIAIPVQIPGIPRLVDQAIGAHSVYVNERRHAVEVAASEEAHLVGWLSKRLGKPVKAPDMASAGFALVGGRLLPDAGRPAAQFMYEDAQGRRVTLYVRADNGRNTAFKFAAQNDASAFYWIDGSLAYALTGNVPRDSLLELARLVYEAL